jgi:hypothetical protein
MRRGLLTFALALGVLTAGLASPQTASAGQQGWVYKTYSAVTCDQPRCGGSGALPPWIASLKNPFFVTTDGNGHTYHRATIILIGRPGHARRCDATAFSKPFTGRCVFRDYGIGLVRKSVYPGPLHGKPTFWVKSETASFNEGPWVADPFPPYPFDTGTPFRPGHYTEADILGTSTPGVNYDVSVRRTAR